MRVTPGIVSTSSRRIGTSLLCAALVFSAGCLDLKPPEACSVTVAPISLTLPVNGSAPIVGTAFNCDGNTIRNKRINYSSSNTAVATVTDAGQVLAIAVGSASISAVADGKSASVQVTVTPEQATTVTVTPNTLTLRTGNTRQLTATARNNQNVIITGRTFRWSSSNTSIASVDQTGFVIALTPGNVVITAETDQTVGQAAIQVTPVPIGSCSLTPTSAKVTTGQNASFTITLRDTAAVPNVIPTQGRPIVWTSDNEVVATVSTTGLVTTRRAGTAQIKASPVEFPAIDCRATVEAVDPRIDRVTIQPRVSNLRLGIPRAFGAILLDSTNTQIPQGRVVVWSTNTPTTISLNQTGIVTPIALGTARLIATSEGVADTLTFTVTRVPVQSVTLSPLQTTIVEGQTAQFQARVTDSTGTEVTDRTIEWLVSDPTRASITQTGRVTALAAGAVTVFAEVEQRVGQANLIITQIPVDTIVAVDSFTVNLGAQSAFAIELRDAQGNVLRNRNVLVTSNFPGVAVGQPNQQSTSVSVAGLSLGTATFTLQAVDANNRNQGKASRVVITVRTPPGTGGGGGGAPPPEH
ncbi:Ig-like domain-containing protein [Gemmatimonas sp. UBA7669]|uniref:Ig-like domain-containing protein n=1 Tax=Gemmatimonas sp. UBA7669 TaxID=1946568 RepID=UPI0025C4FF97|nr:Ig-like domain-containing protein [Gemmatimonas sp. UBA7669]